MVHRGNAKTHKTQYALNWMKLYTKKWNPRTSFKRLSVKKLMQARVRGQTQNPNESLHSGIWNICLKSKFMGKKRVEAGVAKAIPRFNRGADALGDDLESLGLEKEVNFEQFVTQINTKRVKLAQKHAKQATKETRCIHKAACWPRGGRVVEMNLSSCVQFFSPQLYILLPLNFACTFLRHVGLSKPDGEKFSIFFSTKIQTTIFCQILAKKCAFWPKRSLTPLLVWNLKISFYRFIF